VAGAVTSLPASMAVFAIARKPVFAWYLAMGLGGSLAAGILWQLVS
ncbi:MAG: permease, partial [Proteobacteria bacterium]|nr:permease [Pseudomonadota bacterium]